MVQPPRDEADIFQIALAINATVARAAYLRQVCGDDAALHERVVALLKIAEEEQSFLEHSPAAYAQTVNQPLSESPGTVIGPYKLLEQIGEGGFGIVYMADQQAPVRRRVALKIIKPGMDTKQVLARFKAELQALSLMDHPNIARALDAGATDSGRPYFVMELVRGVPITEYCDQNNLDVHERLDLFVTVCHAVQHAHQKGIIHRDIKPSNVLVTMSDGRPVPKVIDFGVAKAINQQLTPETIFTRFAEMIGTPLYMSPEQAEMTSLDIDTRSDIYSLGVLLYELLTGTTPFEKERLKQAAFDEIRRIIREDEPPKPSTRISTLGATSAAVAAHRHSNPNLLGRLMRGDLDWIVMKALEKDRTRRYETANGLAMDLQRHLADEAVLAGPPSAAYRFHKFARRNRAALAMTAVVTVAMLLGIVGTTWQAIRATRERDRAVAAESLAEASLQTETKARAAEAEQRIIADAERREAERQRQQADANFQKARQAVEDYFKTVSESRLLDMPGLEPLRKELLESALKYYQSFAEQHADDPERQADLAVAHLRVSQIMYGNGDRQDRFFPHLEKGIEILERLVREGRDTTEVQRRVVGYYRSNPESPSFEPGNTLDKTLMLRCAERFPPIWEKFVRDNPDVAEFQDDLGGIYVYLALAQYQLRKYAEALHSTARAIAIWEKLAKDHPREPRYRRNLAGVYEGVGRLYLNTGRQKLAKRQFLKSLPLREQVVREFPHIAGYRTQLGLVDGWLAESAASPDEAEQASRKAVDQFEKVAAEFPTMRSCRKDLALAYLRLADTTTLRGKRAEAIKLYRQCIKLFEALVAEPPVYWKDLRFLSDALYKLSKLLKDSGQQQEAEAVCRQSIALYEKLVAEFPDVPQNPSNLTAAYLSLSTLLTGAGRHDEVAKVLRRAVEANEKLVADFPKADQYRMNLGHALWQLGSVSSAAGRHVEAEKAQRQAVGVFEKLAADFPAKPFYRQEQGYSHWNIGALMKNLGRLHDAEVSYREASVIYAKLSADFPNDAEYRSRWSRSDAELIEILLLQGKHAAVAKFAGELARVYPDKSEEYQRAAGYLENCGALARKDESLSPSDRKAVAEAYGKQAAELLFEASKRSNASPESANALAWKLATRTEPELRSPARAVELARKAVEGQPSNGMYWNTLGVAQYRAGEWKAAETTLRKSMELRSGGDSFDWLFVGMCLWQQGEKHLAKKWYDAARLWMARKSPTNSELIRFQSEAAALLGLPKNAPPNETDDLAAANALVDVAPQARSYELRGTVHAARREWDRAADDFAKAIELGEKNFPAWYERALVRRAKDDKPGFQAACADMLKQFAETKDGATANYVAWTCALGPDALTDFAPAIALAEKAAKIDANSAQFADSLGAILYRAGRFSEARQKLEEADRLASPTDPRRSSPAYTWFFLAMTHHRLMHADEAKKWLVQACAETDKALKGHDAGTATLPWNRRLTLSLLRREAETLLGFKQPPAPETKKEDKPVK